MELYLLDEDLNALMLIDQYTSAIWTERYSKCGDFQLVIGYNKELYTYLTAGEGLQKNLYLRIKDSSTLMVVESLKLSSDSDGVSMRIEGRSLESILDRRIVYDQLVFTKDPSEESSSTGGTAEPSEESSPTEKTVDTVAQAIKKVITSNVTNPDDENRVLPRFVYADPQLTPEMQKGLSAQYFGDNVLDVIVDICQTHHLGFRVNLLANGNFEFSIFEGLNRAADQTDRPMVVFSPKFENLMNSDYVEDATPCKTIAVIFGEGSSAPDRMKVETTPTKTEYASGMLRRELCVDASGISQKVTEAGITWSMTDEEYAKELQNKGKEELKKNTYTKQIDGEIDVHAGFIFGIDYFLGDIVQVENEYGTSTKTRVTEHIRSYNAEGYSEYPTFEKVEEQEEST